MNAHGTNSTWGNARDGASNCFWDDDFEAPVPRPGYSLPPARHGSNNLPVGRNGSGHGLATENAWPSSSSEASTGCDASESTFQRTNLARRDTRNKPAFRITIDRLSIEVTDFDLAAILPPHIQPSAVDFPPPKFQQGMFRDQYSTRWACYAFDQLDEGLECWNHLRMLHVCGHLRHLCASPDQDGKGLALDVWPPLEDVEDLFGAAKSIIGNPAPNLPPFVHITNLLYSATAEAILALIPAELAPHARVEMLHPGKSLSATSPQPQPFGARHVGRAQIYFDTLDQASHFYDVWERSLRKSRDVMRIRHYGSQLPFAIPPRGMYAMMRARAKHGDEAFDALLQTAFTYPKPPVSAQAANSISTRPLPPAAVWPSQREPTPNYSNDDTFSTTSSHSSHPSSTSTPPPHPTSRLRPPTNTRNPPPTTSASSFCFRPVFVVFLTNMAPRVTAADLESLILHHPKASTFHPPLSVHLCRETRQGLFAYKKVAVRPVKYVFKNSDDAREFCAHVRRLDKAGELDAVKADDAFRVSAYLARAEEDEDMEQRWRM
ncbi:hypothetical protein BCR44DRAFT_1497240 [Catenaria anguillulae PL171]|uniref:Uncharacterized protein n=1 Tax=Catenaria anguillulae PL171 TaxID=765915 RepID=A0A1Y2HVV3_9FUNG|nr:hypothetical protein BCR44DRAFT_1497240 [Catenaria anguillulae PL171]